MWDDFWYCWTKDAYLIQQLLMYSIQLSTFKIKLYWFNSICKKHRKIWRGEFHNCFMQACWRFVKGIKICLHLVLQKREEVCKNVLSSALLKVIQIFTQIWFVAKILQKFKFGLICIQLKHFYKKRYLTFCRVFHKQLNKKKFQLSFSSL